MQSSFHTNKVDDQIVTKILRSIHSEMREEFEKYGFTTLGQYTEEILKNRKMILNSTHTPPPAEDKEVILAGRPTPSSNKISVSRMEYEEFIRLKRNNHELEAQLLEK